MKYDTKSLEAIPILDIANKLGIIINKSKAQCFIHQEKTPSCQFYDKTNSWYCFGCSSGGGNIDLVSNYLRIDFCSTCNWLIENFPIGYSVEKQRTKQNKYAKPQKAISKKTIHSSMNKSVSKFIVDNFQLSKRAIEYMVNERSLSKELLENMKIFSIDNVSDFYKKLDDNFSKEMLVESGLYSKKENAYRKVFYKEGIVFPYFIEKNIIKTFQLRPFVELGPKYIFLNNVKKCLYNQSMLHEMKESTSIFICEGAIDVLSALEMGHKAIGVSGASSINDVDCDLLSGLDCYILFDNDDAGKKGSFKLKEKLESELINVNVVNIEEYNDVNSLLQALRRNK